MPREGAGNLIAAVAEAMGKKRLDAKSRKDRQTVQKGCFILNQMGVSPKYDFRLYIDGPFDRDLADDYHTLLDSGMTYDTDVPPEYIEDLSGLLKKGTDFIEAYTTLILVARYNPEKKWTNS